MGRIENCFTELRKSERKAFIAYITAGDPTLDATITLVKEFGRNGVDIIELGVPFSDPVADGPVNQEAAQRALLNKISVGDILSAVREIRKVSEIPIIFFTYCNSIIAYGIERFVDDAAEAGVDGALVLDMPPEEADEYKQLMDAKGLATVFLVSPITPSERLEMIAEKASGFVYYVSQMGVTGERSTVGDNIAEMVSNIRKHTNIPVAVGFGISSPEQVLAISQHADGVVVGSAIVKRIGELGGNSGFEKEIANYVGTLTAPLKGA